jgi:hypothetical protein|tara:strand:- start:5576 stop:5827 length:252 start_codon:yes stop_codon:yes gene_type:complete
MRGYSQIVIEANQKALLSVDGEAPLALQLGEVCIAKRYPAASVAERLRLSRQTVYDWFSGKAKPQRAREEEIKSLIEELGRLI